jgi:hypothetical protein
MSVVEDQGSAPSDISDGKDIYAPSGLLVLGFLAFLAWFVCWWDWSRSASKLVFALCGIAIVMKITVLALVVWLVTPKSGGTYGRPIVAILKIAAIVLILDATYLWLAAGMNDAGMTQGWGRLERAGLQIAVQIITAVLIKKFIYKFEGSEAMIFGGLMVFANSILNFALIVQLAAAINPYIASQARIIPGSVANEEMRKAMAMNKHAISLSSSEVDGQVIHRIAMGGLVEFDSKYHRGMSLPGTWTGVTGKLMDQLFAAGVHKVFFYLGDGVTAGFKQVIVELPVEPGERAACLEVAGRYRRDSKLRWPEARNFIGDKYIIIDLVN